MKLYIKEFYKSDKRYFLCKEHHITLYEPFYVLYDLKNKCYLRLVSGGFKGLSFKSTAKIPYYYNEYEIKTPAFTELGLIPYNKDTIYPALYCQKEFGE